MLIDANILLYAVDSASPLHLRANTWLTRALNGPHRVAIPWASLIAFIRIATNPRASDHPLSSFEAIEIVRAWLDVDTVWIPQAGPRHAEIMLGLVEHGNLTGNLVSDAHLAALAIEHGLVMASNDSDFARFEGLRWENPLRD